MIDGGTIIAGVEGIKEKIRLVGLDTPEVVDPRKPVQCFGREASKKAKEVLENQSVRLESDQTQGDRDKYGRLLRYMFLSDGTLYNKLMIEEGYGHEYTYNIPYKYSQEFKAAQEGAREAKRGLWADGVCERVNAIEDRFLNKISRSSFYYAPQENGVVLSGGLEITQDRVLLVKSRPLYLSTIAV